MKKIKTFEEACAALEINPQEVYLETEPKDVVAYKKLRIIIQAINDGWMADFSNPYQNKWFPVFYYGSAAGLVSSYSSYAASLTNATIGSRLCFETEEKADYAGQQFLDLYKDFIL